jgi:hypothetical protein
MSVKPYSRARSNTLSAAALREHVRVRGENGYGAAGVLGRLAVDEARIGEELRLERAGRLQRRVDGAQLRAAGDPAVGQGDRREGDDGDAVFPQLMRHRPGEAVDRCLR